MKKNGREKFAYTTPNGYCSIIIWVVSVAFLVQGSNNGVMPGIFTTSKTTIEEFEKQMEEWFGQGLQNFIANVKYNIRFRALSTLRNQQNEKRSD